MALEPGSAEYEATIAHLSSKRQQTARRQRAEFCAPYPAGECPAPSMRGVVQAGYTTRVGKWDETHYRNKDGAMVGDWEATARARIANAPALYAGGGLLAAYLITRVVR